MKSHCPIKSVVSLLGVVLLLNGCYKEEQQASPELAGNEHVLVDFATPGIGSETQIVKSGYDRERVLKFPTTRAVVALECHRSDYCLPKCCRQPLDSELRERRSLCHAFGQPCSLHGRQ